MARKEERTMLNGSTENISRLPDVHKSPKHQPYQTFVNEESRKQIPRVAHDDFSYTTVHLFLHNPNIWNNPIGKIHLCGLELFACCLCKLWRRYIDDEDLAGKLDLHLDTGVPKVDSTILLAVHLSPGTDSDHC